MLTIFPGGCANVYSSPSKISNCPGAHPPPMCLIFHVIHSTPFEWMVSAGFCPQAPHWLRSVNEESCPEPWLLDEQWASFRWIMPLNFQISDIFFCESSCFWNKSFLLQPNIATYANTDPTSGIWGNVCSTKMLSLWRKPSAKVKCKIWKSRECLQGNTHCSCHSDKGVTKPILADGSLQKRDAAEWIKEPGCGFRIA